MNATINCSGSLEDLIMEHKRECFPHLSLKAYFLEMAKQRAEEDLFKIRGNREKN